LITIQPYNQKRTTVKFNYKNYASKPLMAKKIINQAEVIITMVYLFLVSRSIIII